MRRQSHSPRKVIAVDLDEVLARTTLAIADFHNDTYGTSLTMDDFVSYDYTKIWGGTREESIAKWRLFFDSPYFLKVEPVEGSLETLKLLKSRRYSLVIVTARQQFVADLTKKFVDRHFPGIFESIYFANHFLTEQEKLNFISKPKSVICKDVHAQLLIDDSLENATEVAKAGIPVLLFDLHGAYKWNKLEEGEVLPDKVTRVKSWKDVQAWFPRPRSPLSSQVVSRDDQVSESESDSDDDNDPEDDEAEEEDESEEEEDEDLLYHRHQEQQAPYGQDRPLGSQSESDSDEDLDEEEMNDLTKREQDEEDHHSPRTLRRRKLMMMDFSSEDEDDYDREQEQGQSQGLDSMDSDDQDYDLESGRGRVPHSELERYRHQHENMYTEEHEMEVDMETEESAATTTQEDDDEMERGPLSVVNSIECAGSNSSPSTIPLGQEMTSPEAMAVEGLTIKSPPSSSAPTMPPLAQDRNMDMEEVPL